MGATLFSKETKEKYFPLVLTGAGAVIGLITLLVILVIHTSSLAQQNQTIIRELVQSQQAQSESSVTTVKQRCDFTKNVEELAILDRNVLVHFIPAKYGQALVTAPYNSKITALQKSYKQCEVSLKQKLAIAKDMPGK
jgi:hypothetical protein